MGTQLPWNYYIGNFITSFLKSLDIKANICWHMATEAQLPWPGPIEQSVASPTADLGVASLIQAKSHNFVEIDDEIISTVILLLPLIQEELLSVTSESMCTKYWL